MMHKNYKFLLANETALTTKKPITYLHELAITILRYCDIIFKNGEKN